MISLCSYYSDNGADELLIYDPSETDEEHEHMIGMVKEIARAIDIPLIVGGRVKRLEDVKKYLYAGASATFLNVSDDDNLDLIKEASHRFGSEKIYAYLPDFSYLKRTEEFEQLGACKMILNVPHLESDQLEQIALHSETFLVTCDTATDTLATYLNIPTIESVIPAVYDPQEFDCMNQKQILKKRGIPVDTFESSIAWSDFKLNTDGMIPVIVQDYQTSEVLMLAYMNEEAFHATLKSGKMTYYSRSRQELWLKGETSGHYQYVKSLRLDCDND
ncbi:MAG: phosphoribosyl-AMP cyclohydrolase, partial [Hungatella sp.]